MNLFDGLEKYWETNISSYKQQQTTFMEQFM